MENENKPRGEHNPTEKGNTGRPHYNKNRRRRHNNNRPRPTQDQIEKPESQSSSEAFDTKEQKPEERKTKPETTEKGERSDHKGHSQHHRPKRHHKKHKPFNKPTPQTESDEATDIVKNIPEAPVSEEVTEELSDEYYEALPHIDEESQPADEEIKEGTEELVEIIGVRFKAGGKTYYFEPNGIVGKKGMNVIVETARGQEFGEIAVANSKVPESDFVPPLRPVIRIATEDDVKHHDENSKRQDEAFKICNEKIIAHGLDMKLIDAQYTFDNTKLLFYFTSSGRVDFRELVKDLASVFKTRIELRQIGIRDEAKIIGGLGICGRPLCCSRFLSDFGQVSIKMAKEQNLSLNSAKISGACGRLMCCLRYEYDTYVQEIKNTPPLDSRVKTPDGIGIVTEMSPLAGKIKVKLEDKPDQPPKTFSRDEVTVIPKQKQ